MQGRNIRYHLSKKIQDWANSVDDSEIKDLILTKTMITGGAIVSLLQGEMPHDYDVYFRDGQSLLKVAEYYVKKYIASAYPEVKEDESSKLPIVQRCKWNEEEKKWTVINGDMPVVDERIRVFIRSEGITSLGASFADIENRKAMAQINADAKTASKENKHKDHYRPVYMTNNAITLSDKVQLILRFYGEPEQIHENYDFIHCTSYWKSWDNELVLPSRALEAIINKELYYVGSKYPLCSLVRTRKFLKRGWTINAGQLVKMALQLHELNLTNLHVFEEQLIGVDSAYFMSFISLLRSKQKDDPDFSMCSTYLIDLINTVFDDGDLADYVEEDNDGTAQENSV